MFPVMSDGAALIRPMGRGGYEVDCFLDKKQVNPENAHPSERYNFKVSTKQRVSSLL